MQYKKEQFANKGRDTFFNGYIEDKFKGIYREFWAKDTTLFLKCHFYILINILLNYYIFTRSGN